MTARERNPADLAAEAHRQHVLDTIQQTWAQRDEEAILRDQARRNRLDERRRQVEGGRLSRTGCVGGGAELVRHAFRVLLDQGYPWPDTAAVVTYLGNRCGDDSAVRLERLKAVIALMARGVNITDWDREARPGGGFWWIDRDQKLHPLRVDRIRDIVSEQRRLLRRLLRKGRRA